MSCDALSWCYTAVTASSEELQKAVLVLDIDHTLVHTEPAAKLSGSPRDQGFTDIQCYNQWTKKRPMVDDLLKFAAG